MKPEIKLKVVEVAEKKAWDGLDMLIACAESKKGGVQFDTEAEKILSPALPDMIGQDFRGKTESYQMFYPLKRTHNATFPAKRGALIGLGKAIERKKTVDAKECYRRCGGRSAELAKKYKTMHLGIIVPELKSVDCLDFIEHFCEGLLLGFYSFTKYKTVKDEDESFDVPSKVYFIIKKMRQEANVALAKGKNAAYAVYAARDMANEPGNGWRPKDFAQFGKSLASEKHVHCTVLEKADMERLAMGGLLGVNQGSKEPPKLVIVDYCPEKYKKTVMLVGKGLTFDSGGVSLKPGAGMMDMKYDMCGGAAVLGAMQSIVQEKPSVRVVALVPSTDNMAGGAALKPGDIITHYGGITSEIENTDAEGRLILADALAYGKEQFQPDYIIDLATLTGAVIIALGHHFVGALSNDDRLCEKMMAAAAQAGEPQWRLPLDKVYAKQLESKVADIRNTGGRPAGTITAAEYLQKFVGDTPCVHLDIAGTAWGYSERSYVAKDAPSGVGTRTLIEFIRRQK